MRSQGKSSELGGLASGSMLAEFIHLSPRGNNYFWEMKKLLSAFIFLLFSLICQAQNCFVFVGGYNKDASKDGLYVFEMDTTSGALTKVSTLKGIVNPTYFTLSANGAFLYSCTNSKLPRKGTVASFSFDAKSKELTWVDSISSEGENPVYVSIDKTGQWLANANYSTGSVSIYSITPDGKIELARQIISFTDSSVNKARQERSHVHSAVFSPDNNFLFAPDLGADKIWRFGFYPNMIWPLKPLKRIKTIAGSGPRHLVFSPNGKYAYCTEELTGTVSVYKYTKGKLKQIQRLVAHADTATVYSGSDVHISPDGKFLYASNRANENTLAIFSIEKNGKLKLVGRHSTMGNHPRVFALSANGKFVLVANQVTGNVVVFKRDSTTGLLTYTGFEVKVENASCVIIKQYE